MTNVFEELVTDAEALVAKLKTNTVVATVETDLKAIGASAGNYIKNNSLTALYAIAMSVLTGAATGTPWATIGAAVVTQGEAAGISIAKGAESIVLAQAQADLVAAGAIVAPTTGTVVASPVTPSVATVSVATPAVIS